MSDYESHTRQRYREPGFARNYAARQKWWRSPAEWAIGRLEKKRIRSAVKPYLSTQAYVLDIPAGSGKLRSIFETTADLYVAGDISEEMLRHMPSGDSRISLDGMHLPFPSEGFDIVVCLRLLHRVPVEVLNEILREELRVARRAVVFSYGGRPSRPLLRRVLRALTRRPPCPSLVALEPDAIVTLARELHVTVISDKPVSSWFSSERIVVFGKDYSDSRR